MRYDWRVETCGLVISYIKVCVIGVSAEEVTGGVTTEVEPIFALITPLVFGPTLPYPVVYGVPEETMEFLDWKALTAVSVSIPKYVVGISMVRSPSMTRKRCRVRTSSPVIPL